VILTRPKQGQPTKASRSKPSSKQALSGQGHKIWINITDFLSYTQNLSSIFNISVDFSPTVAAVFGTTVHHVT